MYEAYLRSLSTNPLHACHSICETFFALHNPNQSSTASRKRDYHKYIELYVILQTLFKKNDIAFKELELKDDIDHNISLIVDFFIQSKKTIRRALDLQDTQELIEKYRSQYETNILSGFSYEFDGQQIQKITDILIKINESVRKANSIDVIHKARLKASLERLKKSVHKNMSNMDRFWGFMFETRLVLKGDPEEIQPVVAHIQELANIYYQVISATGDELPFKIQSFLPSTSQEKPPQEKPKTSEG